MKLRPWAIAVFALAFLARLLFLFGVDQTLLYSHQYQYFHGALTIAEHPHPLSYVLRSDEWRTWDNMWTIAPLYFLFAGSFFRALGAQLVPLLFAQCLLDSLTAVAVGALGRQLAGRHGHWAGVAYALCFPAVELTSWTMTENLHTPLLVIALALMAREAAQPSPRARLLGGFLLGLSALARAVSSAFIAVVALWRLWPLGLRRGMRPAALVLAGGAAAILPWTARNFLIVGDHVLIESAAFENLWWANNFVDNERYQRQRQEVYSQMTPAAGREAALRFALRGIQRHPGEIPGKIRTNFWHFLRPEGLHNLVRLERSEEPWRHALTLLLDDLPLIVSVCLFCVFVFAGRPSPARGLMVLWVAYYLFMVVVIFHNEIRYRSAFMPFAFAGAAGAVSVLADATLRRRVRTWLALALGLYLSFSMVQPYLGEGWRALRSAWTLRPLTAALDRRDWAEAERIAATAADEAPRSARPWLELGSGLAWRGEAERALAAYRRGAERASIANWSPRIALPRLLAETGEADPAAHALRTLDRLSWDTDPWYLLEIAWRELPPPHADEIRLAQGDYGAVRGFFHPRGIDPKLYGGRRNFYDYARRGSELPPPGTHRWTRHRAWLRLVPTQAASAYDVTLEMGAPFPSTLVSPVVSVRANGGAPARFTLSTEVRPYTLRATATPGEPLLVQIDSPTWCLYGEPADEGVRVDRMTVRPAS